MFILNAILRFLPMTKLFAVGFPHSYDEMQLAQLFAPHGDIDLLTIVRDKFTGKSKGLGFIHMKTAEGAAAAAAALDGYEFQARKMEVRLADEKPQRPMFRKSAPGQSQKKRRPRM